MVTLMGLLFWTATFVITFGGGLWLFAMWLKSFDFKLRIREITSNKVRLIHDAKGKIVTDTSNVQYLKLFKKKGQHNDLPLPPPDAIDYDPYKKKKVVELWYSDETGYVFVKDQGRVEGFHPFTTNQRTLMVNQLKKKDARKKTPLSEIVMQLVPWVMLLAILVSFLLFVGDAVQPMIELGDKAQGWIDKLDGVMEKALMLENNCQVISGGETPPP